VTTNDASVEIATDANVDVVDASTDTPTPLDATDVVDEAWRYPDGAYRCSPPCFAGETCGADGFCHRADAGDVPSDRCERTCYQDSDRDTFGDRTRPVMVVCGAACPDGTVDNADDCDDSNRLRRPGYPLERCDGVDDDCDGFADNNPREPTFPPPMSPSPEHYNCFADAMRLGLLVGDSVAACIYPGVDMRVGTWRIFLYASITAPTCMVCSPSGRACSCFNSMGLVPCR